MCEEVGEERSAQGAVSRGSYNAKAVDVEIDCLLFIEDSQSLMFLFTGFLFRHEVL